MRQYDDTYLRALLEKQEQGFMKRQLESLETLASGVAHEFNNILASVSGYSQMAIENMEDEALVERALRTSLRAAQRGTEIVTQLSHFARIRQPDLVATDIGPTIRDIIQLFRTTLNEDGILLKTDFAQLPPVRHDPALLSLAVVDIMNNARQAILRRKDNFPRLIRVTLRTEENEAVLRIRDSAGGMPEEDIAKATEPFFTTKGPLASGPLAESRGLGLSSANGIVNSLGGKLSIDSYPEEGTEVRISFRTETSEHVGISKGLVLVIDDEISSRRILSAILEKYGYRINSVESAAEGMKLIQEKKFDLIILDQVMPGKNGTEMLKEMGCSLPTGSIPPVIMVTGEYSPELAREALSLGAMACTSKPINRDKISYLAKLYTSKASADMPPQRITPREPVGEHILVVDSDHLTREILCLSLDRTGYRTTSAASGKEAKEATSTNYFDLILIDILLPDSSGTEVVRQLRMNNPYTPILISTSNISHTTLARALKSGATKMMHKPIDVQHLIDEVGRLVEVFEEN